MVVGGAVATIVSARSLMSASIMIGTTTIIIFVYISST